MGGKGRSIVTPHRVAPRLGEQDRDTASWQSKETPAGMKDRVESGDVMDGNLHQKIISDGVTQSVGYTWQQ
jgi:hypothetical protein